MLSVNPHPAMGDGGSPFQWKYCRMCALELKQGVFIFGEEGRRLQIPEKIRKTVAILVLEEDTLPKKICTSCCNSIEQYLEFKASVQDAQEKLTAIAKSIEKSQEQSLLQLRSHSHTHSHNQQQPNMLPSPTKRPKLAPVSVISHSSSGNIISHSHHTPGPSSSTAVPVVQQQAPSLIAGEVVEVDMDDPDPDPMIDCNDPPSSVESFNENDNDDGDGASISRDAEVQIQIQVQSSPPTSSSSLSPKPSTSKQATTSTENGNVAVATEKEEDTAHLVCGICVTKITDKSSLEEHHSKDHKDEEVTYGCSACPRITPSYEAIRQHIYRHRMAGTFKCADCDKSFPTKDQLHVHISSKHNPDGAKAFQCESCGNQYGSNIALLAHQRKVHCEEEDSAGPAPGPSSKSPAKTSSVEVNPNPESSAKDKEDGFWKCEICEKIFQSKFGYETHVATHKGRRFACEHCGVSYTQKPTLDHHIRVHHTNLEREFECPECHKQFKTLRQLGWHKKTHERPLTNIICPQCDKKFLNMISLKTHMKLHKGVKNHPCSECPKSFYSRQKLEEHMNSHTGRRPVGCPADKCQKFFSCLSNYAKHFKKFHLDQLGPPGRMIPPPKMREDNNNEPQKQFQAPSSSSTSFASDEQQSHSHSHPLIIPTLNSNSNNNPHPPSSAAGLSSTSSSMITASSESQSNSNSHLQSQTQPVLLQNPSSRSSGLLPPCSSVANLNASQAGVVTIPSFSTTSSQTQTQTSTYNFVVPPPSYNQSVSTSTSAAATTASSTQTLDNNMNVAHCNSSSSSSTLSLIGANLHTSPNSAQAHSSSSIQTQTLPTSSSSHAHQFQMPSHSHSCPPPQPQTQSVWQPVMLPSSKNYHSSGNSTILLPSFEILDCAPLVPVPAHHSESHHQHQSTSTSTSSSSSGPGPALVPVSVVVAHNSTTSSQSHPHSSSSGSNSAHASSSSSHAIPVSNNLSVNVPHFVPSSQQSEPMELSYKLTDSNNFQDVPMELTKVFQRDPLELCVRQEFAHGQPLMDLSSRVVNVGGMSVNLNGNANNSSASGSSSGGNSSQNAYPGALSGSNSNGIAYHKSVTEVMERELTLNDFTGAFRQPIDLIARSDDHPSSHELCSEGNLVDLSLRSSFGQDQSASSFLRELIDLSSRSDTFHGEINLTNKPQTQPSQSQSQSQIGHHPHQQHQHHPSSSHHHHHHQHPPPTHLLKSGGNNGHSHHPNPGGSGSHHHHHNHHHHPPHHVQNQSHPSSNSSATTTTVTLQNVIYPELNFSNL